MFLVKFSDTVRRGDVCRSVLSTLGDTCISWSSDEYIEGESKEFKLPLSLKSTYTSVMGGLESLHKLSCCIGKPPPVPTALVLPYGLGRPDGDAGALLQHAKLS